MAEKGQYIYEWPRPMVTVDAVIFKRSQGKISLLLINRKNTPYIGHWAIPGGFVEMDEELEDAAARELAEETNLKGIDLEQMHTFGKVGRDPRGRQITIAFIGFTDENNANIKAGDDAAQAKWFDIDDLPQNMAFDHDEVAKFAIERLKEKYDR
ncbi:MAG: NUDIX hydrolase [Sedimentisphaerales bacterium]|nr:NUDIX hydrolase [Sedimentisphaerales bacterium]